MADLTNPDNWVSVEQLDYFKGKLLEDVIKSLGIRSGVKVVYNTTTGIKTYEPIGITEITSDTTSDQDEQNI